MANSDSNSVDSSISHALNTMFDIRALANGAYGILESAAADENSADAYRLTRLILERVENSIEQLNQAGAAMVVQKRGAA
jgi:hypothetical protein